MSTLKQNSGQLEQTFIVKTKMTKQLAIPGKEIQSTNTNMLTIATEH